MGTLVQGASLRKRPTSWQPLGFPATAGDGIGIQGFDGGLFGLDSTQPERLIQGLGDAPSITMSHKGNGLYGIFTRELREELEGWRSHIVRRV